MIIGVDASTVATGFAFGGPGDAVPRGGVWKFPGADELNFDRTLDMAGQSLHGLARMIGAKEVAIEAPMLKIDWKHSRAAASALIQLTGALRAAAHRAGCRVFLISVAQAREHFIGTARLGGDDGKAAVQARCRTLRWPFADDNQADANAVWALQMARTYPRWAPGQGPLFAVAAGGKP